MSANVDLVRSICEEWERGNYAGTDWQRQEMEFVIADGPTPGSWTGPQGIAEGWGSFLSAWEGFRTEVDEYRELDGERVLVLARFAGRGRASGLEIAEMTDRSVGLFHVRNRKVTRLVLYLEGDRALATLGLAL